MNAIEIYKKEITKKYNKKDNTYLLTLFNEGKKEELITSLLPLVLYCVGKYNTSTFYEELIGVGNMALIEAIENFNPQISDNIISYSQSIIKWSIIDFLNFETSIIRQPKSKNVKERTKNLYAHATTDVDYEKIMLIDEPTPTNEKTLEQKKREIERLLMSVPKLKYSKIATFLMYYFTPNITYKDVSRVCGYSPQNVSLIIIEVLDIIKKTPVLREKVGEILYE